MNKVLFGFSLLAYTSHIFTAQEPLAMPVKKAKNIPSVSSSMEPNIGISRENRTEVGILLNNLLSNQFAFYVKALNYHWNVESHHFNDLHALFKNIYEKQFSICDDIAERVRALGEVAFGTMQQFTQHARLQEQPNKKLSDQDMIKQLLEDLESIIRTIRIDAQACADKYDDLGTNNFLLNLLEKQEKTAWMLRASLVK